jgi:hypothetical protein
VARLTRSLHRALAVTVLGLLVVLAVWLLHGGRLYVVESPSMGTRAPVGSLVAVSPATVSQLRVGDVVTVRPAGRNDVWTHQVRAIHADGTLSTSGRISGTDPWRIDDEQLVGRAHVLKGLGWLVKAAPLLLVSTGVIVLVLRRVRRRLRLPLGIIGASAALSAAVVVFHPLQGAEQLQLVARSGGAVGSWVNTGLLPLRLAPLSGEPDQVIAAGEVAHFRFTHPAEGGRYGVRLSPEVPWLLWLGIVGGFLLPATIETVTRRAPARRLRNSHASPV